MAVLTDQEHPSCLVHGNDPDRARVLDHLAPDFLSVGHSHGIAPDVHDLACHDGLPVYHWPGSDEVLERRCRVHAVAAAIGCPAGCALDRSIAAEISPLNSGCGLVGRDRNSGCACVATKYGCTSTGSSTNSTSRPSGDIPEQTKPASSSAAR